MTNESWFHYSNDEVIFVGRNKAYGAFQLRSLYTKHMSYAMIAAILFSLMVVNAPHIYHVLKGYIPASANNLKDQIIILDPPPMLDPITMPPPPLPKIIHPPRKNQIQFILPVVVKEEVIIDEESLLPTNEELKANAIGVETLQGEEVGLDASLIASEYSTGTPVMTDPVPDKPYTFVEQMPSFPGGEKAMYEYIYQKIKYPAIAIKDGISGLVVLQFVVNTDGTIEDVIVVHGIGGGCNEEALRVVNDMPKWKPGKHNGKTVPVTFTLPIRYVLQ